MHLGQEGLRARPDGARGTPASTAADPAGTDTEMVFVVCHDGTIGRSNDRHKVENYGVVLWRRNTCASVETAESRAPQIAGATHLGTKFLRRGNSLYLALLFALISGTDLGLRTCQCPRIKAANTPLLSDKQHEKRFSPWLSRYTPSPKRAILP